MTVPAQKPGKSVQDVGTPREFLNAVEKRFGRIAVDLAAHDGNAVCDDFISVEDDAFEKIWHARPGLQWLNPPFANIGDWAMRAAAESGRGAHILMLIPAAIGTNYFCKWIWPFARIYALSPRLKFVGHTQPYPKDLILCEYSRDVIPALECWRWKGK
jgi:phage N-6-adenine-methyltransferase